MQEQTDTGGERTKGKKSAKFPSHPVNFAEFAAWIEQERTEPEPEAEPSN